MDVECKCLIGSGSAEHPHPSATFVNFVEGEVQQGCVGGVSIGGGVISGLPKRTSHMISCYT